MWWAWETERGAWGVGHGMGGAWQAGRLGGVLWRERPGAGWGGRHVLGPRRWAAVACLQCSGPGLTGTDTDGVERAGCHPLLERAATPCTVHRVRGDRDERDSVKGIALRGCRVAGSPCGGVAVRGVIDVRAVCRIITYFERAAEPDCGER